MEVVGAKEGGKWVDSTILNNFNPTNTHYLQKGDLVVGYGIVCYS
jgi:hypothetical protein